MPLHYGLIGHPLGHSLSPFIHRRLFALQGREGSYTLQDLEPSRLKEELPALLEQMAGLNVTIPYKQEVLPFLDTLDGRAALYRSVNTIAVTGNQGRPVYTGYNTDADGFRLSLVAAGIPLAGRVALLGCGGVSRTFACEAALAGCAVVDAVRDPLSPRALQLREDVERLVPGASFELVSMGGLSGDFDLLINGTPVGMTPHPGGVPRGAGRCSPGRRRCSMPSTIPPAPACCSWRKRRGPGHWGHAHAGVAGSTGPYLLVRSLLSARGYRGSLPGGGGGAGPPFWRAGEAR